MRIEDITVEIRNKTLDRVAQIMPEDLVGSTFILSYNQIGSWELKLHNTSPAATLLKTPGYGIILTGPSGVILSGPMVSAQLDQSSGDLEGTWTIKGYDDSLILGERLAYPDPSENDVSAQTTDFDESSGPAETVLKDYVDQNLVSGPIVRQVDNLVLETDLGRGSTVYGRARFNVLQEMFFDLAQSGGVGYTIKQEGNDLVFSVYEPEDKSALVKLDIDNGLLTSSSYSFLAPSLTRAIVGGAGEAVERLFYEGSNFDSTSAESLWGRRIEHFVDARSSKEATDLAQKAEEALVDEGKTRVNISVTPSDNQTMLFGEDWGLGDTITVVVNDLEATAIVYTVAISIQSDGIYLAADVGSPIPSSYEIAIASIQKHHNNRLSEIETKTTGFGIVTPFPGVQGGTSGTQPTFSGPVFTASYTRFGDMIHFAYSVDFTNILTFGTGQYYMTLPYQSRRPTTFSGGALYDDSGSRIYSIIGIVDAGSAQMNLYYLKSNGETEPFEHNKPITLTVDDTFDISGVYEIDN